MVSSKDTVSEQVVQARQTRRRRTGFWVRPVLAGRQSRVVAAAGSNSKRDRRTREANLTGRLLAPSAAQTGDMQGSREV